MRKLPKSTSICTLLAISTLTAILPSRLPADPQVTVKRLAPGIVLTQEIDQNPALIINVVTVDLKASGVHLGVGVGKDYVDGSSAGREEVTSAARRHGAIAAINADYFSYICDPLGLGIRDGELYSEPWTGYGKPGPRTVFGVLPDGRVILDRITFLGDLQAADGQRLGIAGIDRPVGAKDTIVFTSMFGPATAGNLSGTQVVLSGVNLPVRANKTMTGTVSQVVSTTGQPVAIPSDGAVIVASGDSSSLLTQHFHVGDKVGFVFGVAPPGHEAKAIQMASLPRDTSDLPSRSGELVDRSAYLWAQTQEAVSGGPRLLVDGRVDIDAAAEGFGPDITDGALPRTAAGISADGNSLILVTVDGRQSLSHGVTLTQLASILLKHGAAQAINFDGGGSTALSIAGVQVNSPGGDGYERPVADMLFVYSDHPYVNIAPPKAAPPNTTPITTTQAPGTIVITQDADPEASQEGSQQAQPIAVHVDKNGDIKLSNQPAAPVVGPHIIGTLTPLPVGGEVTLHVVDENGHTLDSDSPNVIWQGKVSSGIGFVDQRGQLSALNAGSGTASALYKGQLLTFPVQVTASNTPAGPSKLTAQITASPAGSTFENVLTVRLATATGAPISGATVVINCTGGTSALASVVTNLDGSATTTITWSDTTGGSVSATTGNLPSVSVNRPQ